MENSYFLFNCRQHARRAHRLRGSSKSSSSSGLGQFTHVFVVFPPSTSDPNYSHFMNTVMPQKAIEGVTVGSAWMSAETGTPGPGTCSPVGTDTCQSMPSAGRTPTTGRRSTAPTPGWFSAQSGSKKVYIIVEGIGDASSNCLLDNTCINPVTPYYVTTSSWAAHTQSGNEDLINANKDGCTNYLGLIATSMTRSAAGLVTVTEANHGYSNGDTIWIGSTTPSNFNIAQESVTNVQVVSSLLDIDHHCHQQLPRGDEGHVSKSWCGDIPQRSDGHHHERHLDFIHRDVCSRRLRSRG